MNISKIDYGHMLWYIREYMWVRPFDKLNKTIRFEEAPFSHLMAGLCTFVICVFGSFAFAFEYIILGKGHGADLVGYMMYCDSKNKKENKNGNKRNRTENSECCK